MLVQLFHCSLLYHISLSYHEAGAPFGSVMYQYVGKMAPFLVLAVIAVLGGGTVECCTQDQTFSLANLCEKMFCF